MLYVFYTFPNFAGIYSFQIVINTENPLIFNEITEATATLIPKLSAMVCIFKHFAVTAYKTFQTADCL